MEQRIEEIIAKNIIELRKIHNLKQSDLAEQIGYSDKTVSRWENGTSVPDIATLMQIADYFNIGIEDLVKENAIEKSIEEAKNIKQEKMAHDVSMFILSILAVWTFATILYVVLQIVLKEKYWQVFIWAIPISGIAVYLFHKRNPNIYWLNGKALNIALLTAIIWGTITATYLQLIQYNLWQIFLLPIPFEAMIIVYVLLGKKNK